MLPAPQSKNMKRTILTAIVILLVAVLLLELGFLAYQRFGGEGKPPVKENQNGQTEENSGSDTAQKDSTTEETGNDPVADPTETTENIPETDGSGMPMIPVDPQTGRPVQSGGADTTTQPTQSDTTQQTQPKETEPVETGDSTEPGGELEENELPRVPGSF